MTEISIDGLGEGVDDKGYCLSHPAIKIRRLDRKSGEWTALLSSCPLCDVISPTAVRERRRSRHHRGGSSVSSRSIGENNGALPGPSSRRGSRCGSDGDENSSTLSTLSTLGQIPNFPLPPTLCKEISSISTDATVASTCSDSGSYCLPCSPPPPPPAQPLPPLSPVGSAGGSSSPPTPPRRSNSSNYKNKTVVCGLRYTNPTSDRRGSYTGQLHPASQRPHGMGTLRYADGSVDEGEWIEGMLRRSSKEEEGVSSRSSSRSRGRGMGDSSRTPSRSRGKSRGRSQDGENESIMRDSRSRGRGGRDPEGEARRIRRSRSRSVDMRRLIEGAGKINLEEESDVKRVSRSNGDATTTMISWCQPCDDDGSTSSSACPPSTASYCQPVNSIGNPSPRHLRNNGDAPTPSSPFPNPPFPQRQEQQELLQFCSPCSPISMGSPQEREYNLSPPKSQQLPLYNNNNNPTTSPREITSCQEVVGSYDTPPPQGRKGRTVEVSLPPHFDRDCSGQGSGGGCALNDSDRTSPSSVERRHAQREEREGGYHEGNDTEEGESNSLGDSHNSLGTCEKSQYSKTSRHSRGSNGGGGGRSSSGPYSARESKGGSVTATSLNTPVTLLRSPSYGSASRSRHAVDRQRQVQHPRANSYIGPPGSSTGGRVVGGPHHRRSLSFVELKR